MFPCIFKRHLSSLFVALVLNLLLPSSITASNPSIYRQVSAPTPTPSSNASIGVVIGSIIRDANLRIGPGTNFAVIGIAEVGQLVTIVGINTSHDWYFLDGGTWIAAFLVNINADQQSTIPVASTIVTGSISQNASLRAGPGTNFDIAGNGKVGDPITIVGINTTHDWYLLDSKMWIAAFLVNISVGQQSKIPVASIPEQGDFIDTALKEIEKALKEKENPLNIEQQKGMKAVDAAQKNLEEISDLKKQAESSKVELEHAQQILNEEIKSVSEELNSASDDEKRRFRLRFARLEERLPKAIDEFNVTTAMLRDAGPKLRKLIDDEIKAQKELALMKEALSTSEQKQEEVIKQNSVIKSGLDDQIRKWKFSQTPENFNAMAEAFDDTNKLLSIEGEIPRLGIPELALPPPPSMVPGLTIDTQKFTPVQVFYVTDRNDTGSTQLGKRYGAEWRDALSFGTCIVTIPNKQHSVGGLESPSIWALEFKADPASHVILTAVNPLREDQFYTDLSARMAITHEAFVFIHGYNVTFEDAARRTAQIAYDLNFQGAPIFYSWPSRGTTFGYAADEESIQLSTPRIKDFLAEVAALTNAQTIHLIAHSIGNRGLTTALIELGAELPIDQRQKINQIVLAAPDINAAIFKKDIASRIAPLGQQVTLYASSRDFALGMSKLFHGFARAGESGSGLVLVDGIQTIDASNVSSDLFNHSYPFALSVLADIYELFHDHDFPKDRFNLEPVETATGRYWQFKRNQ